MDKPLRPVLSQHEIESLILDTSDRLEHLTEAHAEIAHRSAITEADFRLRQAQEMLRLVDDPPVDRDGFVRSKMTVAEREARVEVACADARRDREIASAARESSREALNTHRSSIDALRTLAANVRYQTSPR